MDKNFISKCNEINEVLVDAVFNDQESITPVFNERGYHYKNNRQILIGFNTIITEIVYHKSQENEEQAAEFIDLVNELHANLCNKK
jgi:hypothetical protein